MAMMNSFALLGDVDLEDPSQVYELLMINSMKSAASVVAEDEKGSAARFPPSHAGPWDEGLVGAGHGRGGCGSGFGGRNSYTNEDEDSDGRWVSVQKRWNGKGNLTSPHDQPGENVDEYQKVLEVKRKAQVAMKAEERKVELDKSLEKMEMLSLKKGKYGAAFIKVGVPVRGPFVPNLDICYDDDASYHDERPINCRFINPKTFTGSYVGLAPHQLEEEVFDRAVAKAAKTAAKADARNAAKDKRAYFAGGASSRSALFDIEEREHATVGEGRGSHFGSAVNFSWSLSGV